MLLGPRQDDDGAQQVFDEHHRYFFERVQDVFSSAARGQVLGIEDLGYVAGVDVAYGKDCAVAAAVAWSVAEKRVTESSIAVGRPLAPYEAGFLFLREGPLMVGAVRSLKEKVGVVLVDGHGIAHPRRAGLAVFVGGVLGKPSIGIAKSRLVGKIAHSSGVYLPVVFGGSVVGYAVKPKGSRMYFVSPGFGLQVDDVVKVLDLLGKGYPEVLRRAHMEADKRLIEFG